MPYTTLALLFLGLAVMSHAEPVTLVFEVAVPRDTPTEATVYLAGNHPGLGGWQANGLALARGEDGLHRVELTVAAGTTLAYKLTLGSWTRVEKTADHAEVANRQTLADRDQRVGLTVEAWSRGEPPRPIASTVTGDVRLIENFASGHLRNRRTLRVYLPPGYDNPAHAERRYPVFYLHDGQNLFDRATAAFGVEWQADEAAERLIAKGIIKPIIIVGLDNTGAKRLHEYTPWPGRVGDMDGLGGGGGAYAAFVVERVKPYIDKHFRTQPGRASTAVGGSSLGGLMTLHLLTQHPEVFGRGAAMSPSLWWADQRMTRFIEKHPERLADAAIWLDMGTAESARKERSAEHLAFARRLADVLEPQEPTRRLRFRYFQAAGGDHSERAWAERFPAVLTFLFPAEGDDPAAK